MTNETIETIEAQSHKKAKVSRKGPKSHKSVYSLMVKAKVSRLIA